MATVTLHLVAALLLGAAPMAAAEWKGVPDAVREAVTAAHPDAVVREVGLERHRANPVYRVMVVDAEGRVRLEVGPDGTIREERTRISAEELPAAVAAMLAERFPGRREVARADRVVATRGRRSATTYEIEMTVNGRLYGVFATEAGAIVNVD